MLSYMEISFEGHIVDCFSKKKLEIKTITFEWVVLGLLIFHNVHSMLVDILHRDFDSDAS
jgi:hypothetical protein